MAIRITTNIAKMIEPYTAKRQQEILKRSWEAYRDDQFLEDFLYGDIYLKLKNDCDAETVTNVQESIVEFIIDILDAEDEDTSFPYRC